MGLGDRLIQFVLRGKDELSPEAAKTEKALSKLASAGEELQEQLGNVQGAEKLARQLDGTRMYVGRAEEALQAAQARVNELRKELDAAPSTAGLQAGLKNAQQAARAAERDVAKLQQKLAESPDDTQLAEGLRDAEQAARRARTEVDQLRSELDNAPTYKALAASLQEAQREATRSAREVKRLQEAEAELAASATEAGIDTGRLSDEISRLGSETQETRRAISANAQAQDAQRTAAAELARAEGEHVSRLQATREAMLSGVRTAAGYAAAYLGIEAAISAVRTAIVDMLQTGDQAEALQSRMASVMGGIAAGEQATSWIKDFARTTPLAIGDVSEAFMLLKSYGLDPMDGTLQALTDKSIQLGGGMELLTGVASALGQAQAKQKLQTEEILQLVERGIPAWEMLEQVTGRNTEQLMEMASAGALGRDVIAGLIDEMGRSAEGAAAAGMSRLSGLISNLEDTLTDFYQRTANAGALDYLKGRLQSLLDTIGEMDRSGRLDELARSWSDAFIAFAGGVETAGRAVVSHAGEVALLVKAYTAFKIGSFLLQLAELATGLDRGATRMRGLAAATDAAAAANGRLTASAAASAALGKLGEVATGTASRILSLVSRINIYAAAAVAAVPAGEWLGESLAKLSDDAKAAEASLARNRELLEQQRNQYQQLAASLAGAGQAQIQTTAQLQQASADEIAAYREKLSAAEQYQKARYLEAFTARELGQISEQELAKAREGLQQVKDAIANIEPATKKAADALRGDLTPGALDLVTRFGEVRKGAEDAGDALEQLGEKFDPRNTEQLRDMGVALQYLGQYGQVSGEQIEEFLLSKLQDLSSKELVALQQSAREAFQGLGRDAEAAANIMDAALDVALSKLGLDLEQIRTGFDASTRDVLEAFDSVVQQQAATGRSAEESAAVITEAYIAARKKIDDPKALEKLEQAFKASARTAGLSASAISDGMLRAEHDIRKAADAMREVADAKTVTELDRVRQAIEQAYAGGRMSAEEYAKAMQAVSARRQELVSSADDEAAGERDLAAARREGTDAAGEQDEAEKSLQQQRAERAAEYQQEMQGVTDFVNGVLEGAEGPLTQMSMEAMNAYRALRGLDAVNVGIDTSSLDATRASLQGVNEQLGKLQMARAEVGLSELSKWQLDTLIASNKVQQSYLGQKARLQDLLDKYQSGSMSVSSFISAAQGAASGLSLLDQSDLSGLESALASARQQMQGLGDDARDTLGSLQDELNQLQGNSDVVEQRRFATRRQDLQAQMAEAQAAGNSQAVADLQRAIGLLRQIENESAAQRFQQSQQQDQQPSTPAQQPAAPATQVIRLESSRGRAVDVSVPAAQATDLLAVLEDAGMRAI